jgi:hypothetical protein
MARRSTNRIPADEDLTWWLMHGDSALGRSSSFCPPEAPSEYLPGERSKCWYFLDGISPIVHTRNVGPSRSMPERRITDRRFGWSEETDAARARTLGRRWFALQSTSQRTLALAYGISLEVLRKQISAVSNLETWQAVERAFGQLAAVALVMAPDVPHDPDRRRRVDLSLGGPWATQKARQLFALAAAKGKPLTDHQAAVNAALGVALADWWGVIPTVATAPVVHSGQPVAYTGPELDFYRA